MARPTTGIVHFVRDIDKTLEYFTSTLGFTEVERYVAGGDTISASLTYGSSGLGVELASIPRMMRGGEGPEYDFGEFGENIDRGALGNGVVTFFRVPNVDRYFEKINRNGAMIDEPPTDQFWGHRTISVRTPDGYYLTFWQPIKGWKPEEGSGMELVKPKKGGRKATTTKKRR